MRYLPVILCAILASCTTPRIPVAKIVPIQTAPNARRVDDAASKVSLGNERIRQQMQSSQQAAAEARRQANEATRKAEALAHTGKATQAQLDELWNSMKVVQARNLFLEGELGKQSRMVNDQALLIDDLRHQSQSAIEQASAADAQASIAVQELEAARTQIGKLNKENTSLSKSAASAGVYKHWVIGLAAGYAIIAIVLPLVMKYVNPLKV